MFFGRRAFKETSGVSILVLDFDLPMVDMAALKRLKYPRFDRIRRFVVHKLEIFVSYTIRSFVCFAAAYVCRVVCYTEL